MEPRTTQWLNGSAAAAHLGSSDLAPTRSEVPTIGVRGGDDTEPAGDSPVVALGQSLGKYQIRERLGRGGQAQAFLAFDPDLHRDVVIKFYHAVRDPADGEAVLNEGRALARVHSPFVAQCHGADRHEGAPYLVLEYVPGETLAALASRGRLDQGRALRLAAQIAEGLAAIHAGGLLHLDLKPSNILVGADDRPRIVDFGLATTVGSERLRKISGTPAYMAPEQARGEVEAIGPRADVFGLGAVLYEMLVGRPPYQGASPVSIWNQARQGDVVPPAALDAKIPGPVDALCRKALAKQPGERWESADEFRRQIERIEQKDRKRIGFGFQFGRFKLQFSIGISLASVLALFAGLAWMEREAGGPQAAAVAFHTAAAPDAPELRGSSVPPTDKLPAAPRLEAEEPKQELTPIDLALGMRRGGSVQTDTPTTQRDAKSVKSANAAERFNLKRLQEESQIISPILRKAAARRDFAIEVEPAPPCRRKDGAIEVPADTSLELTVKAARDCTVGLWWVRENEDVVQLWPSEHEPDSTLVAKQVRTLPAGDGERSTYRFPAITAGEQGRLLLIARTHPLTAELSAPPEGFRVWSGSVERTKWAREISRWQEVEDAAEVKIETAEFVIPVRGGARP